MSKHRFISIFFLGCMVFLLIACVDKKDTVTRDVNILYLPDVNTLFENYERAERLKNYDVFAQKIVNANRDLHSSELYLEAASLHLLAGNKDSVVILIHKAIDNGMANPMILKKYEGIEELQTVAMKRLVKRLDSISEKLNDIAHFSLEMNAMESFWPYFDNAKKNHDSAKFYFKEYIFEGPREVRDYYAVRYYNLENMYGQMINASPKYYSYLKEYFNAESMEALKTTTTEWMEAFKKLYPTAVFPKVYVVPGMLNSGGTVTEMGLFIGGDMYGRSQTMPTEELSEWQRDAIMNVDNLPGLILHELMHFQQNYGDEEHRDMVIHKLIDEGVCDFLVELSSGVPLQNEQLTYLQDPINLERITDELREELFSEDLSKWMYNGGSIEDRPHDLGYTLGYLISKSYYMNMDDKQTALYELLNTKNMLSILRKSDYAYLLEVKSGS